MIKSSPHHQEHRAPLCPRRLCGVGLQHGAVHKGWLCAVWPCHLRSSLLWTSSSIKHGEEEPSYTSVPMGWTRYYEASDQHTVGAIKKKTQLLQRYLLPALLSGPSLWLEVTRHRTRFLGRETKNGGDASMSYGEDRAACVSSHLSSCYQPVLGACPQPWLSRSDGWGPSTPHATSSITHAFIALN